ncbi:O-antigen ligase family protein [Paraburkholderia solisilvae]|uniref:O-antigen ligase-related domain-containing protein n=1 Tax=Paraburkholderia solisilvae TaxID=624376 RepID=A0A6J5DYB3_9BURK|nr:O-antigen ligase family protein [Paraburkholderia solisilvae]CAB3758221.1 hypothetical protein LMG29739_02879 [Paraburkholderia solisilvae]
MEIQVFGVIVFALGVLSLNLRYQWAIYFLVLCSLFSAAATVAFPALGGLAIVPVNLFLLFFALRAFNIGGGPMLLRAISPGRPGFWLVCVCAVAALGAMFLPRALAGTTYVFAIDRAGTDPNAAAMVPLAPVSGNLSQSVYVVGELVLYCCMSVFLTRREGYQHFAKAVLLLAALNVCAAVIDLATYGTSLDILSAVKTAGYTLHDGEELAGLKRITGTFAESAAFSYFTLPLFAFTANLWLLGYRPKITGLLSIGSGVALIMSTSATAYVGFVAYLFVLFLGRSERIAPDSRARKRRLCIVLSSVGVLAVIFAVTFKPSLIDVISDFFSQTLLAKADSDSGVERTAWNMQAIKNFIDTFGMGVGVGSSRASSFLLVTLSNLGVLGTTCFGLFVARSVLSPISTAHPPADRAVCYASRQGMLGVLIVASVSGTVFELGACFYLFAAAAAGLALSAGQRVKAAPRRRAIAVPRAYAGLGTGKPAHGVAGMKGAAGNASAATHGATRDAAAVPRTTAVVTQQPAPHEQGRVPAWPNRP